MGEEIIDVVKPIEQGQPNPSFYVLLPLKLRERQKIAKETSFAVILAENGDIIYRRQGGI